MNDALPDEPEILNTSPYEDGWMIKLKLADDADFGDLMDASEYMEYIEKS